MTDTHPKWNFKEFSSFLMLYAAMADDVVTPEEKQTIIDQVDHQRYDQLCMEFNEMTPEERHEIILSYKGLYFPTIPRRNELLSMVKKEFLADGEYSFVERSLMRTLEKLM